MGVCTALALEVIFNVMRSINPRFTYLLTYLPHFDSFEPARVKPKFIILAICFTNRNPEYSASRGGTCRDTGHNADLGHPG